MNFLETITIFGNDVLVPIDRIKFINLSATGQGYELKIESDDGSWIECFPDEETASKRYQRIKEIIKTIE